MELVGLSGYEMLKLKLTSTCGLEQILPSVFVDVLDALMLYDPSNKGSCPIKSLLQLMHVPLDPQPQYLKHFNKSMNEFVFPKIFQF